MCMCLTAVTVGVAVVHPGLAGNVKRLHLNEGEGAGAIEAYKDKVGRVGERGTSGLHEGAELTVAARPTIDIDSMSTKDGGEETAEDQDGGVVACAGEADAMGACDKVAGVGADGDVRWVGCRGEATRAVGGAVAEWAAVR